MRLIWVQSICCFNRGQSEDESSTKPFRKEYDTIGCLRAVLPKAIMVAMTATAPVAVINGIRESLNMSSKCHIMKVSPDKPNIRFVHIIHVYMFLFT